jgi:hypothetical protein
MSGLFSSPGKSAQQGASGAEAIDQGLLNQIEQYTGQQQQAERGAIAGIGANPYFVAAETMSPTSYRVNPGDTTTFGTAGAPGTHLANPVTVATPAMPWKPSDPSTAKGGTMTPPLQVNPPAQPPAGGNQIGWGPGARGHETL